MLSSIVLASVIQQHKPATSLDFGVTSVLNSLACPASNLSQAQPGEAWFVPSVIGCRPQPRHPERSLSQLHEMPPRGHGRNSGGKRKKEEGRGAGAPCGHCPAPWLGWSFHCHSVTAAETGASAPIAPLLSAPIGGTSLVLTIAEAITLTLLLGGENWGTDPRRKLPRRTTGWAQQPAQASGLSLGAPSPVNLSAGPRGTHGTSLSPSHPRPSSYITSALGLLTPNTGVQGFTPRNAREQPDLISPCSAAMLLWESSTGVLSHSYRWKTSPVTKRPVS